MKAVGLFSGGLDSILALKIVLEQGIDVVGVYFTSAFFSRNNGDADNAGRTSEKLGVKLKVIDLTKEHMLLIRKPKHGYGAGINPCIDCRIFMLKQAKKYAKKIGAKFIFTGEVLGQRPMSQQPKTMELIEKKAGLKGKIVRPLCARLLPVTAAEKNKWVKRAKLLSIHGRSRKIQIELANKYKIKDYPNPGGGCLLTQREFANRVKDLFKHKKRLSKNDIELLKVGRHFRFGGNKIIVGRNEAENRLLEELKPKGDLVFEAKDEMGPITLLQGKAKKESVSLAASLTARYSDASRKKVVVRYGKEKFNKEIVVQQVKKTVLEKLRI